MREKLLGLARLARPANLPTAAADIFAGAALALWVNGGGVQSFLMANGISWALLVLASILLYAGGVVFNDVFDADLDAVERPERAIPQGVVSIQEAIAWGCILMIAGNVLAFLASPMSGVLALVLSAAIITYDAVAKNHGFFGPLAMGVCRGLNLILGMSVIAVMSPIWYLSLVPVVYIFAITLISRGEVHGNNKAHIVWAGGLFLTVAAAMLLAIMHLGAHVLPALPFLGFFLFMVLRPLMGAHRDNSPKKIKKAVISGVLALIVMDACWVAGFADWTLALPVLLLLPLSLWLSKLFAVT
ncbi:UbiA-like protein EboC [Maribacter sp. 2307ULW6-5]|uniref:UbiA-like protein EboC n=1 Tax=Maribacter sp. 2307ULW6-5 TaxID=3386275 RepID=UPI0039BCC58E